MTYTRTRSQWGARGTGGSTIGRVSEVIVHTEAGAGISSSASIAQETQRMRAIDAFHLSLGWHGGFGYSAAVFPSGRVYEGRGYRKSGAHTRGRNTTALAFVVPGHGDRTPMTEPSIRAARRWIGRGIWDGAIVSNPKVSGHRDYANKSCPGNRIYPQLVYLRGVRGVEDDTPPPVPPPEDVMNKEQEQILRNIAEDMAAIRSALGSRPNAQALDDLGKVRRTLRHLARWLRLPDDQIEV